ncbi:hypothetical protein H4Q32_007693 [Labeo rohita]|uniref:ribonuclease H n=1 Tax=Labeo rohita TaxID=84645 RepID=A0ABQ8MGI6_LABRO|nr:hypothetical protein H4Q32_007693 [Labeo rohita]
MQRLCVRSGNIHLFVVGSTAQTAVSPFSLARLGVRESPGLRGTAIKHASFETRFLYEEAGAGDEREESSDVLLGASPKTARSECLPMECPDDFESSSQYGLDLLFGAPAGEKEDAAASEGERKPSEVDVTAEFAAPAAGSQSMADAEMAATLQRAAREIGVVWAPPPGPEPSRLDDWFLGKGRDPRPRSSPVPFFPEVHEELTRSWKAPLSARSRYANSPSLTTLDGGPARGYTEVPQVERAIAMHLCLQNAASWRGQPKLPSRACKFSSTLVAKAYSASGQAASALHAMAILQVYQAKVLKDLHEGVPDPELERHLWLNLAEMRDAEKVRFLDAPISQAGLFGETVEEFALQFSTVKKQTEAIKHILPRRVASSSPAPPRQQPPPAPCRGRPPTRAAQDPRPAGPAAAPAPRSSSRRKVAPSARARPLRTLVLRPLRTLARLRSGPETGRPGRRDRLTCPDPHSTRGRALDSASNRLSAPGQTATTWTCGHTPTVFPHVLKHRACSDDFPSRGNPLVSSHGTNLLGAAASGSRGFLSPATHCPPSHTTPIPGASGVTPLRPLAENISGWLNIPNLSRWLLRTIRLGYAIQFARRPPKFRGVLATSVRGSSATVLRAEIAVLLAKGVIETVPSAEMRKGFYSPYFIVPKKGDGLRPILDLRILNRTLHKRPFKMLTLKHLFTCVRAQDWFVAIDLKDAYFHVSILPRHRPFLRFAFEGRAYQYRVLPFCLSLSPLIFTKIAEAALTPLREMGIHVCNYLDDWLILAHSLELVCTHREVVLNHLAQLGLRVNWEKSKLSPVQRISFLGVELDSIISAEVCGDTQMQVYGPPKTGSEASRAHGIRSRGHAADYLIIRFLKGARRLNPPRPHLIPSWDLAVVLQGLQRDPFEPLQSVEVDALSLKTALLTALTSVKRVGDLQALSVNNACLKFGPADSHVVLRPRPGYVPKVPTTPFRDQVVTLQAISSQEDDPNLTLLCPVRALRQQKGKAVSKQRISHWFAIRMAYEARGLPCPLGIRAHSTRGVAASAALANGASLTDICRAAVAPQAAPCVYFPPIAHYGAVFPLRSGCDLRSASFPRETVTSPTSAKTLSRSTETGPAAGHCCNRSVLGRWKVMKSVRQIGNVSVTYGNPRSLMEGTETLCLPCHNSGPSLSELRRSAPHIRTSEQMHTLPYLYPDEPGVASYANLHTQFSLACFYTVRGVWAPKSDP